MTISPQCLGDDSAKNAMAVYDDYENTNVTDVVGSGLAIYNLHYSMNKYCPIQDVQYDIVNFLAAGKFTFAKLFDNFLKKFFTVTGALNTIGEIYFTTDLPPMTDVKSYFTIYQTIGVNIGGVINIVLGFQKI